jgi:hypothetical protein
MASREALDLVLSFRVPLFEELYLDACCDWAGDRPVAFRDG